jgi:hypothetical protein
MTFADAPPTTPGSKCGISKFRGRLDRSGGVSPSLTMFLSKRWRVAFRTATRNPPLSKWLWVLKDAGLSHLSVPLLVKVSRGQQPWETFVVPVDPSGELGFATPSHSRTTPVPHECCPHFASGSCPWENYSAIDFVDAPRGAIRENVCVTDANGSTMKDRSLPERFSHCEVSLHPRTKSHSPAQSAQLLANWPLPGVKGHIPTKRTLHGRFNDLCHCGDVSPREISGRIASADSRGLLT